MKRFFSSIQFFCGLTVALGLLTVHAVAGPFAVSSGSTSIAPLVIEDSNTVAQRNSTTAQSNYVYNTYTSSTSFERGQMAWASNILNIGSIPGSAGGSVRNVRMGQFNSDATLRNGLNVNPANDWTHIVTNGGIRYTFKNGAGLDISVGHRIAWSDSNDTSLGTADTGIARAEAGVLDLNNGTAGSGGTLRFNERTAPSAPAADKVVLYAKDNGAGKTTLCARFATGAEQCFATEP